MFKDTRRVYMWAGWQKTAVVSSMGCFSLERERQLQGITNTIYPEGNIGWHCIYTAKSPCGEWGGHFDPLKSFQSQSEAIWERSMQTAAPAPASPDSMPITGWSQDITCSCLVATVLLTSLGLSPQPAPPHQAQPHKTQSTCQVFTGSP